MTLTRRRLLSTTAGIVGAGLLAGCGGTSGSTDGDPTTQASFFVFGDIAANIAGDVTETDLLVPIGQHGHGWEPGPSVREDIHAAELFVHGMTSFQPWVDSILGDLEADGSDVTAVDVSTGVDLLEAGDHDDEHAEEEHHSEEESHSEEDPHSEDEHSEDEEEHHSEEDPHSEDEHSEDEEDHDHGEGMDPHFWMDPLRVKNAASTVQQGLADVDDENASAYADNAEQFQSELDELHDQIETVVSEASAETLLIAGHDSFQYFADRYDIEVEALTNVSPDDRPSTRDIEHAQEIIEDNDLQYICADPLESQEAADQLVAETDAEEVLPLTAMPGLTEEWGEAEWGYVDVMEKVNLPTLEQALDT